MAENRGPWPTELQIPESKTYQFQISNSSVLSVSLCSVRVTVIDNSPTSKKQMFHGSLRTRPAGN